MKIVIIKDATTDHLVPLTLEDSDSIADLIKQWSKACGRDGSEYIFKTIEGEVLSGEVLISELSVPLSGYSSLEIIAERTARLFVCIKGPGSFGGKMLEIQLALSFTIGPLASVVCQVLQIPDQELEFRTKAPVGSCTLPSPLRSDISLAEQCVQEDEEVDCDFSFDFVVSSSSDEVRQLRLTCRGGTNVSELLLPNIPTAKQRLIYDGRRLDSDADLVTLLREDLAQRLRDGDSRTVRLLAEQEVSVKLSGETLTAWSGETIRSWLDRTRPSSLETPLWHCDRCVSPDATVASLVSHPSKEPIVLDLDPGLELTVIDLKGQRLKMLLHSSANVDQLMQRVIGDFGADQRAAGDSSASREDHDLFLTLENGRRLLPAHAGLAYCGVKNGTTLLLRCPTEELILECEGWRGKLTDVPKSASFTQLMEAARKATDRVLDDDSEFVCRCGRALSRGSSLPSSPPCCSASPRVLLLHRRIWVTVATPAKPQFVRLRRRATNCVHDVLLETLKRLNPEDGLKRRLSHRGSVQHRTVLLYELAGDSDLTLTLEEEVVFIVESKKRCHLSRVWPNAKWVEVRRLLKQTGMLTSTKQPLELHGEIVGDEDVVQIKNGDVVRVLDEEEAAVRATVSRESSATSTRSSISTTARSSSAKERRESSPQSFAAAVSHGTSEEKGKKSSAPLSSLTNGRGKTTVVVTESSVPLSKARRARMTSIHVQCENSENPSFILQRETPVTVASLREAVAKQWDVSPDVVVMKQYRAFTKSGNLVISADNTAWVDEAGVKYPHEGVEDATVSILTLEDHHPLFIPGCHRWSICAKVANPP